MDVLCRLFLVGVMVTGLGGPMAFAVEPGGPPVVLNPGQDGIQRATIELDDSYQPGHLVVQAGKPVELTLKSLTLITPHNFILHDPAAGLDVEQDVGAGKTAMVRFTPAQPGTYIFYCDKKLPFFPSHREKGMEGLLEVR